MGLVSRLLESRYVTQSASPRDPVVASWWGGQASAAGVTVTAKTSRGVMAVWRAVNLLSGDLASMPFQLFRVKGNEKNVAEKHPLQKILKIPNRWQTPFEYREMMAAHLLLRGNAYSRIIRDGAATIRELIPLHPDRVFSFWAPSPANGAPMPAYRYQPFNGPAQILLAHEVHHWRGPTDDGLVGLNPIEVAREMVGTNIAMQEHGARLFSNGARPGGVLEYPGKVDPEMEGRIKETWGQTQGGLLNAHKVAVLEDGMKWHQVGLTAEDSQWIQSKKFGVEEVGRMFGVPPSKLFSMEKAAFNTLEQQALDYVRSGLRPHMCRIEQCSERDLLSEKERITHDFKHDATSLTRGDTKTQTEHFGKMRQWGVYSVNEIRRELGRNPIGPEGDVYLQPLNMIDAADSPAPDDQGGDDGAAALRAAAGRLVQKEVDAVRAAYEKSLGNPDGPELFRADVDKFYENYAPVFRAALGVDAEFTDEYIAGQKRELFDALEEEIKTGSPVFRAGLETWESLRAEHLALTAGERGF